MQICPWAQNEPERTYHDEEWGVPVHDDRVLFEFITLEGAQAGLSWSTILNRRDGYRKAFCDWDIHKIARLNKRSVDRLVLDPSIVRHASVIVGRPGCPSPTRPPSTCACVKLVIATPGLATSSN